MKYFFASLILFMFLSAGTSAQSVDEYQSPSSFKCLWKATFGSTYIKCDYYDIKIRSNRFARENILSMELFINGRAIEKDTQWPFAFINDRKLTHLRPGFQKVKVKIVDRCRKTSWIYHTIYLKNCPS